MFFERLTGLCERNGESITAVIVKLGLSRGNLSRWRNGSNPTAGILNRLADYFEVSTDYLLGKNNDASKPHYINATHYVEEKFGGSATAHVIDAEHPYLPPAEREARARAEAELTADTLARIRSIPGVYLGVVEKAIKRGVKPEALDKLVDFIVENTRKDDE
jgi:transcriptional regulator with XRE-family HTH domain